MSRDDFEFWESFTSSFYSSKDLVRLCLNELRLYFIPIWWFLFDFIVGYELVFSVNIVCYVQFNLLVEYPIGKSVEKYYTFNKKTLD